MSSTRQKLGRWGESLAVDYFSQKGYAIINRNVRTPYGEIDLIAQLRSILVFVEVKTRSTTAFGHPEAAVTARKREHLVASAQAYLQAYPDPNIEWRINVIAIRKFASNEHPEIIHFENAVT